MPYIAFVAAEDVPARTEFTFDYNPAAAAAEEATRSKKKKGKTFRVQVTRPGGAEDCFCNSTRCRGFIWDTQLVLDVIILCFFWSLIAISRIMFIRFIFALISVYLTV